MFSLVNSSCSSSKISEHKADDKDSARLPPQVANPAVRFEPHTTNFSIRDHVLASRSKNINASWPFPCHLLQICLKNGIRELLPPFEPPSSTKSAHSLIKPASEKVAGSSAQLEQTVIELDGSDEVRLLSKRHKLDNLENDVCGVEKFSSPTGDPAMLKKCRIIQKAGVISETSREEEFISSPSMGSDIMASKICPVCKAFSSTSNTTLNAHMDQCLSMDSDATLGVENFHKIKAIKPRKKKLMVDIYGTAQFCTLEDLDRRNGTTWATDLNPVPPNVDNNLEAKKPKFAESADSRDDKSTEGAVYVDSNGIKIGILSKFNDALDSRELLRSRNNIETVWNGKITSSKEDYCALSSKKMKFKMRNKKLRSLKHFENEVQAGTEVSHHEQSHIEEEGSTAHLAGDLDKSLSCGSATLKSWPSSKRSDLPKKSGKKSFHIIFEHLNSASDTPSSAIKNHTGEFSRVLECETANFSSNAVQKIEKEKKSPLELPSYGTEPNVILLELSRVSGSVNSLPGSTSEEHFKGRKHKSHASPKSHKRSAETCYLPPKTKKISTLSSPNSGSVKTDKHRSFLAWRDAQTRTSKIQFDQKMTSDTLTGASSHNTDVSSIMQKSSADEDRDSQMDTNDKTSAVIPIESKQADKLTQDQLENRAKATFAQEFSACLTSHDELALDIPTKNIPIDLDHMLPNQGNNSSGGQEPLALLSPASSTSTISPASPGDYLSKVSENEPASNPSMTQANFGFPFPLMVSKEGRREMDIVTNQQAEKPCCCSWQSIMAGNMKQKPLSNLHIRPNISSFYAYSNSRTDTSISPSMESPTDSILTKAFSDVGSTSPSCGTPTQSNSNSILRLMGKDLMVINNEESTQIPKGRSPNVRGLPSPFGFASYASAPNRDAFSFPHHNQPTSMIGSQDRSLLPGFHQSTNKKPFFTKEVIVINDSDEAAAPRDTVTSSRTVFQRPFSYFPTHTQLLPMDNGIRPSIPINQGGSFPASHLPSPFVFQSRSTAHLNLPFYYPQTLR